MLVLSRQTGESITIVIDQDDRSQDVKFTILKIEGDRAKVGIDADRGCPIHRSENLQNYYEEEQK